MGQAYTPGLQIAERTRVVKIRELPLLGKALVQKGDTVNADTPVLAAELPGELDIVRVAERLGLEPDEVHAHIKVSVGGQVERGQIVCERPMLFGLFSSKIQSPSTGVVEFYTEGTAHIGIRRPATPFTISAYISGTVVDVEAGKSVTIETDATLLQGIFGVGGEKRGWIFVLDAPPEKLITPSDLPQNCEGCILIGGAGFSRDALAAAAERKASAVMTGSIDSASLSHFVGYEIGVSITGDEEVPFTFIITEGFGNLAISPRLLETARKHQGKMASCNGTTQVRAGAVRPEVIVPLEDTASTEVKSSASALEIGRRIRCIRHPYFGMFGTVVSLPHEPQALESGAVVRVLRAKLDSGEECVVPRANVELA